MTLPKILNLMISFLAGLAVAVVLHFMLYRIGIPLKPFIYVVF
jgi:capsular polysaccharide biosynthesis protein